MSEITELVTFAIAGERRNTVAVLGGLNEAIKLLLECHEILGEPSAWAKESLRCKRAVLSRLHDNIAALTNQAMVTAGRVNGPEIPQ